MEKQIVFIATVTEHESGWGSRPDGHLIATSRNAMSEKADSLPSSGEYSYSVGNVYPCYATEKAVQELANSESGCIWGGRDYTEYGEKI